MASSPVDTDSLYDAPPGSFVAARKQLARALREAGRRDEAKAIEDLPRPTVSVWAVNQLARREPAGVKQLGALTAELRDTQAAAGGRRPYAEVAAGHRAALSALRARAEEILVETGHKPSPQLLGRIVGNLRAGVASAELRPRVEAGRLDRDLEEAGFGGLFELAPADDGPRPAAPAKPTTKPAPTRPDATVATGAEESARQREEEAARRERERFRERALAEAERRARPLRAAAPAAARSVERAERALETARATLAEAERTLEAARVEAARLAKELAAAEADVAANRPGR